LLCRFYGCIGKGERIAVMGNQGTKTRKPSALFFPNPAYPDNIADGFTHLLSPSGKDRCASDPANVFSRKALGFAQFSFVVRENQSWLAALNVNCFRRGI